MAQTRDGAIKICAAKAGVSVAAYLSRVQAGSKWCYACRTWHPVASFGRDASRYDGLTSLCIARRNKMQRDHHVPVPFEERKRSGPAPFAPRDQDKMQARQRIVSQPWKRCPYRLITWWDMYQFELDKIFAVSLMLERIKYDCAFAKAPGDPDMSPREFNLPGNKREEMAHALAFAQGQLAQVGLAQSAEAIREVSMLAGAYRQLPFTNLQAVSRIEEIERALQREMRGNAFFAVSQNDASFYDDACLFGAEVEAKLPRLSGDISEAGKCMAFGRYTACVFHLMRVMEATVQDFGTAVGVSLTYEKNWQNILDEINKAIKAMDQKQSKTKKLAEAAAHLYNVKLAWRNAVMHPKDTYTPEEARAIFDNVKTFTSDLAPLLP